ncbi:rab11, putative [Entamoeba invadens IP1]|uniref:rab11, putative n=1 Tax=Entamoeba invadens IP1 TaxID=370355 RepID=UPI0002C3D419|nr:rab11, putative [Entamoeba invadens IP1]ELP85077.1 rab11, putative [Entamoeba invadens IP1]|eukprot:XP_004184423.1 rab11, putative [Entamoeba invadens IP1]
MEDYDVLYKTVMMGDSGAGKTCLLMRFTRNEFDAEKKSTIGVEFSSKQIQYKDSAVRIQIWDTAGQERYRAITGAYYRGSLGAVMVYDVTKKSSFEALDRWHNELIENGDKSVVKMVIGNKCDLEQMREVTTEEAEEFAKKTGSYFFETSAMDGTNVEKAFMQMIETICDRQFEKKAAEAKPAQKPFLEERVVIEDPQVPQEPPKKKFQCC